MSLKQLLRLAIGIYCVKVLLLLALHLLVTREISQHTERSAAAAAALKEFRALEIETTRYFRTAWEAAAAGNIDRALAALHRRDALEAARAKVRAAILREVASLQDVAQRSKEADEIVTLDHIHSLTLEHERRLRDGLIRARDPAARDAGLQAARAAADSALFGRLAILIDDAVTHELSETIESEEAAHVIEQRFMLIQPGITLVTLLLVGLLGVALARQVVGPLGMLRAGLAQIEADPATASMLEPRGALEIRALLAAYNRLLESLRAADERSGSQRVYLESTAAARARELERANARLMQVDRERTRFLSDISHEIRTPLTLIRGEAEIALRRREPLVEEQSDALRRINDLSNQIALLIEDLLFVARQRDAGAPLKIKEINAAALLLEARDDALALARGRGLAVRAEPPPQALSMRGDPERLRQAILILLDNAARYAADGGTIELSVTGSGDRVRISVANDGPGIAPEELPHVFDRYFRGSVASGRSPEGAGLGLVLAKAIALAHGGELRAESTPGKRTVFTLDLPVRQEIP